MKKREIITNLVKKVSEMANLEGLSLFDVEINLKGGTNIITVKITSSEGVGLDDCHKIHRQVSAYLDELDPFEEQYILEVSSPGLDAPLKTEIALSNSVGREVFVKTYVAVSDYPKSIVGTLESYDDEKIVVKGSEMEYTIERKMVSTIRLHFKF